VAVGGVACYAGGAALAVGEREEDGVARGDMGYVATDRDNDAGAFSLSAHTYMHIK